MDNISRSNNGVEKLIKKYRDEFRCPENTEYYTEIDYKTAERKFIKLCLNGNSDSSTLN